MPTQFRTILKGVLNQEIVIPRLRAYLFNPSFPGFEVPMAGFEKRVPDGYFHPSEHPTWPERQLYFYVKDPHSLVAEPMDPIGTMAVTQGNFWHAFIQTCGIDDGWLKVMDPKAKTAHDKAEYKVEDTRLGTGGYMDGILDPMQLPALELEEGFEIKTMMSAKSRGCPKGAPGDPAKIAWLKEKCPQYYAQAQEYLRMSGYSQQRFLIIMVEYPFPMIEIVVPFDRAYSATITDKYQRVRQYAVQDGMPDPCCGPMDKKIHEACPARRVCPIALGQW